MTILKEYLYGILEQIKLGNSCQNCLFKVPQPFDFSSTMWRGLYLYIVSIKSSLPCWFSSCLLSSLFVLLACNWRGRENQPRAVFTSWAKPCIYLFQPINKLNLYSSIMYSLSLYLLTLHLLVLYLFGIYFVFTSFSGNLKRLPLQVESQFLVTTPFVFCISS